MADEPKFVQMSIFDIAKPDPVEDLLAAIAAVEDEEPPDFDAPIRFLAAQTEDQVDDVFSEIFDLVNLARETGNFAECVRLVGWIAQDDVVGRLEIGILLAALRLTSGVREQIPGWPESVQAVGRELVKRGEDAEKLLWGLEPKNDDPKFGDGVDVLDRRYDMRREPVMGQNGYFPRFEQTSFFLPGECPDVSVAEERARIEALVHAKSASMCRCCGQRVQIYAREISKPIATWLIRLVKRYEATRTWISIQTNKTSGGDYAKLLYWGLIEKKSNSNPEKGSSGLWRPTPAGIEFAYGRLELPAPAHIYNNTVYGYGEEASAIGDAKRKFDFRAIWGDEQEKDGEEE